MSISRALRAGGLALSLGLVGTMAACGGGGGGDEQAAPKADAGGGDQQAAPKADADDGGGDGAAVGALVGGTGAEASIAASEFAFAPAEVTVPAGKVTLTIANEGMVMHTLLFDDAPKFAKLETPAKGDTDSGAVQLEPGTYTFFCDQAGHRGAGMEGTLTVT